MRQLSKIIFIHSANIPYAEVRVDGNVHFSGTQGVGKSAVLRAMLFFYNANPARLGIRNQGQKKFDQFYLPHSSSYIIYEVERDGDRPFSVLVSRQNSRAVYRFVDGPFSKEWLIDADGNVATDPAEVRRRVKQAGYDISNIISNYWEYLDIIYGNPHAKLQRMYSRYYLLRSVKYDNLPRIISNVFLNEKVDAQFIKETIIQSMGDSEPSIHLRSYARQLAHFSEEYQDVRLWSERNRRGENDTLKKANALIATGNALYGFRSYLSQLAGNLCFAMDDAGKSLPAINKEIDAVTAKLAVTKEELKKLRDDYGNRKDILNREQGVVAEKIRHAVERQKYYSELQIEAKLRLEEDKGKLELERDRLKAEIELLVKKAGDVESRFKSLAEEAKNAHARLEMEAERSILECHRRLNEDLAALRKETDLLIEGNTEKWNEEEEGARNRLDGLRDDVHKKEIQIKEAGLSAPYAEEIRKAEGALDGLRHEETELKARESALASKAEAIANSIEAERLKTEAEYVEILAPLKKQAEDLEGEIAAETRLLDRSKGSLIEWLEANKPGWTDTIGRVADEESVLYNTELAPSLSSIFGDGDSSFFGVDLDLSQLPVRVRSPFQIRESIGLLQERLDAARRALVEKMQQKEEEIKKARTRLMAQLNAVNKEKDAVRGSMMMLPRRIDRAVLALNELREKSKTEKDRLLKRLDEEMEALKTDLLKAKENISAVKTKIRESRQAFESSRKSKEDALRRECALLEERQREDVAKSKGNLEAELKNLADRLMEALRNEGVDTEMVKEKRLCLAKTEESLREIDTNRTIIVEYRKDRREYIDRLDEFRANKESVEAKLRSLSEKHEAALGKKKEEETSLSGMLSSLRQRKDTLRQDLEEARHFLGSPTAPEGIKEAVPLATADGCRVIIRNIHDTMGKIAKGVENLKKEVNAFRQPFSSRNTFGFPDRFASDADYLAFATSVREFVENDKIRDYQAVSNSIYKDVLGLISREYSTLAERESEIQKVVNEVNRDCAKRQFAGVIRKIEISLTRSDSAVIRTLQHIHEFWSQNGMEIGEANLFSTLDAADRNAEAVEWLKRLSEILKEHEDLDEITLSDNFSLKIRVDENGNNTGWSDNLKMVGSEGTDILVKAIINILLINVFKKRSGGKRKGEEFRLHCMMDEIGKLAEENIRGIVEFANARGIYIVNSAPKVHSPLSYRYIYLLNKDSHANTFVHPVLSTRTLPPQ